MSGRSAYLDQQNDFVMDRWPLPFIEMNPGDMQELGLKQGDLVEVFNDNGSTQAMVYPTPTAKRKETFMLFAYPTGVQGNVVSKGVNELIIPNYKQTWANIRKIADAPEVTKPPDLQVPGVPLGLTSQQHGPRGAGRPAPPFCPCALKTGLG